MKKFKTKIVVLAVTISLPLIACNENKIAKTTAPASGSKTIGGKQFFSQPLVTHMYTADPSAHVFNNRIYIYPSHDTSTGTPEDDLGSHFDMRDYHILSMNNVGDKVTDHGVALDIKDVPWAGRQLWAPDAAYANATYYLYFPAKDKEDVFRIGVATSAKAEGPFNAEKEPIKDSYSIDPAVFNDENGNFYMYFGGIWGGQLQRWNNNGYDSTKGNRKPDDLAILPRVAKLSPDMKSFAEAVREIKIVDSSGNAFKEKDNDKRFFEASWMHKYNGKYYFSYSNDKRFFEASWMHKYNGKYYFSYSTGDTHKICYAIGNNPYGPFTYAGVLLNPVDGWTNHQSIIEKDGKWWLFYHDVQLSGKTHLRNVKVTELHYNPNGTIQPVTTFKQ
jgi:hypothetical protein